MDNPPLRLRSLVLVPAAITLVVTIVRLVGELNGWAPVAFGKPEAGGGQALLGISWLIFVFGLWFGIRLQRAGQGVASPGRALLITLGGFVVAFGGLFACRALGLTWMPDAEHPGEPRGLGYFLGLMLAGGVVAFVAWPRAAFVLLVYGILARLPVVVVTWFAVRNQWNTHHVKLPPGFPTPAEGDLFATVVMPQVAFWPLITIMVGTAMACVGALVFGRGKAK